ncbi:MAG: DUF1292 domain-containing protein [Oscillospiraceae bacterium]|nr:DUF1292 domain-containing protein [Oscillospiraceae bacterium]
MLDHNDENAQNEMNADFEPDLYTLVDEDGNEKLFELVDVLEEGDKVYFALIPHVENPQDLLEECELAVLSVTTDDKGNEILAPVESDEEYERVANLFIERLEEDCCDCDDDDCDCGCHHHD